MTGKVLLCIDIQSDYFSHGAYPLPHMERASKAALQLLANFRENHQAIIHVCHTEADPASGFLVKGTEGAKIEPRFAPRAGEAIIEKHSPNSFKETELEQKLRALSPQEVVFCGAMSNLCIDASVRAASDLGFACCVVEDACAAADLEFQSRKIEARQVHDAFMAALASCYGRVVTLSEFLSEG